jgi:hypothetical protein
VEELRVAVHSQIRALLEALHVDVGLEIEKKGRIIIS